MLTTKSILELDALTDNHKNNMNLPIETQAVFVTLKHLKDYISLVEDRHNKPTAPDFDVNKVCDAIKICFVRFEFMPNNNQILPAGKDLAGKELTQVSLIFVPVKTADRSKDWSSQELSKNDGLQALCVCEPPADDRDSTGVCPPNKGCKT